ncbi:MAG TPA: hypothetical protein VGI11_03425 [Variovorax sp.]
MAEELPPFQKTFQAISAMLQASVGHTLFTVSRRLPDGRQVERIYTSMPLEYPVGGRKPADDSSDWHATMAAGQVFVASQPSDFGAHFHDLDAIVALGFGAVINIPVHQGERLLGSLNLLDKKGAYRGEVQGPCDAVRALALQGFIEYEWQAPAAMRT